MTLFHFSLIKVRLFWNRGSSHSAQFIYFKSSMLRSSWFFTQTLHILSITRYSTLVQDSKLTDIYTWKMQTKSPVIMKLTVSQSRLTWIKITLPPPNTHTGKHWQCGVRSPGQEDPLEEGMATPVQHFLSRKFYGQRSWQATVPGVAKSQTRLSMHMAHP